MKSGKQGTFRRQATTQPLCELSVYLLYSSLFDEWWYTPTLLPLPKVKGLTRKEAESL